MNTTKLSKRILVRALAIMLCFIMCFTFIPLMDDEGATANAAATIKLGDYVQMGEYYDEPILWRCVAFYKVDENGNVDLDKTSDTYKEGYLPLMLSDKILCLKAFDASGTNNIENSSHGRGGTDPIADRRSAGSNCWEDSNIRCWLNSDGAPGEVEWTCGNPPSSENVYLGDNAYDEEAGFLTNFTQSERNCMKTVTQAQLLDRYEYTDMEKYGTAKHTYNDEIAYCVTNFKDAYKTTTTDTMFLLDVKQVYEVYKHSKNDELGENYYIGKTTSMCIENSKFAYYTKPDPGDLWMYWLRSPSMSDDIGGSKGVRDVNSSGFVTEREAGVGGWNGVRPAFFLNLSSSQIVSGEGTQDSAYIVEEAVEEAKVTLPEIILSGIAAITGLTFVKTLMKSQTIKPCFALINRWCLKYNFFKHIFKTIWW